MELIDRNDIVDRVCEGIACNECAFNTHYDPCVLETKIKELPVIDAVPRQQINLIVADITARKMDCSIYEYAGAYTDGKLAAHSYDLEVINKYCGEGKTNEDQDNSNRD